MSVKTIAVIGAGPAGIAFARRATLAGYDVVLEDALPERLSQALASIASALASSDSGAPMSRLRRARTVEEACREVDFIIEALPEEFELKLEIFTMFDKFARPDAIMASTSRLFSIDDLAEMTYRPELCAGMPFEDSFAPGAKVEIVRGVSTSDATLAACREVAERIGFEAESGDESCRTIPGFANDLEKAE
jgi:3-hydroxybutyryl-CoA dehydrogenase